MSRYCPYTFWQHSLQSFQKMVKVGCPASHILSHSRLHATSASTISFGWSIFDSFPRCILCAFFCHSNITCLLAASGGFPDGRAATHIARKRRHERNRMDLIFAGCVVDRKDGDFRNRYTSRGGCAIYIDHSAQSTPRF